ncbi:MAG: DinB family protein [Anaerolineae bacterium]|nr:DinB family protein [Anaerolineae bacterium]
MNMTLIHTLFEYHYALYRRVWDSIQHLTDAQFVEDIPYSIGSIRNHMVHLMNTDQRWLCRVMGMPLPNQRFNPQDFQTRDTTRQQWDTIERFVLESVHSLKDSDLDHLLEIQIASRPNVNIKPVWQVLVHVVNHGTDHRSQILPILHRMGAPTFEQDLMYHLWED